MFDFAHAEHRNNSFSEKVFKEYNHQIDRTDLPKVLPTQAVESEIYAEVRDKEEPANVLSDNCRLS